MADIRSILKDLNQPDLQARECARSILQRYPGAKTRWQTKNGHKFLEQIEYMADYVGQFSAQFKDLKDKIAVRVIDHFRVANGQETMMLSIETKTPPKDAVDAGPNYNGPNPWAKLMLDAEEISYDNYAEDFYLTVVNDSEINGKVRKQIQLLIEEDFALQTLCTKVANVLRLSTRSASVWGRLSMVQRAYALRGILNHFLPELTDRKIDVLTLMQWAIKDEPKLQGFIPLSCSKTAHDHFTAALNNPDKLIPTPIMSNPTNRYSDTPIAKPTLIYGDDIDLMDDEELIEATKAIQARIDKLKAIPGNSRKIAKQIQVAQEAMTLVIAKIDENLPPE
jgi:hypothetical protein